MAILTTFSGISDPFRQGLHVGFSFIYGKGVVRNDNVVTKVAAGEVTLVNNDTTYIEVDSAGVVSSNLVGYTSGKIPLYTVTVASSVITEIIDDRSFISFSGSGGGDYYEFAIDEPPTSPSTWDDEFGGTTLDAKWSWALQSGAEVVVNGKLNLKNPTSSVAATLVQTAPTGDFRMTAKLKMWGLVDDYSGFGLCIQNSVTDKQVIFELQTRDIEFNANYISAYRKILSTGLSDVTIGYTELMHAQYVRMEVVNGTISMKVSDGGVFWHEAYSEPVATYIGGITDIGFALDAFGPYFDGWVDWFRVEEII